MKTTHLICYAAIVCSSAALAGSSMVMNGQDPERIPGIPADTYAEEVTLVDAQRFTVDEEITHTWRRDGLKYRSGWLLVVKAAPGLIIPRQSREPVLYVGAQTANRVNSSIQSGHVVAIVPGDFLLTDTPIFFSEPALPEELGQTEIDRALRTAIADEVAPPTVDEVASALDPAPFRAADHYALHQRAVDLVEEHSPQEADFIRGQRVPLIR